MGRWRGWSNDPHYQAGASARAATFSAVKPNSFMLRAPGSRSAEAIQTDRFSVQS